VLPWASSTCVPRSPLALGSRRGRTDSPPFARAARHPRRPGHRARHRRNPYRVRPPRGHGLACHAVAPHGPRLQRVRPGGTFPPRDGARQGRRRRAAGAAPASGGRCRRRGRGARAGRGKAPGGDGLGEEEVGRALVGVDQPARARQAPRAPDDPRHLAQLELHAHVDVQCVLASSCPSSPSLVRRTDPLLLRSQPSSSRSARRSRRATTSPTRRSWAASTSRRASATPSRRGTRGGTPTLRCAGGCACAAGTTTPRTACGRP